MEWQQAHLLVCFLFKQSVAFTVLLPSLLITLAALACRGDKLAIQAAMTVKKLATYIRSQDPSHVHLLEALITMSFGGKVTEVLKWTVKAFFEQTTFPHDRVKMIGHKGMLLALTTLMDDENDTVRRYSVDVLCALAGESSAKVNQ